MKNISFVMFVAMCILIIYLIYSRPSEEVDSFNIDKIKYEHLPLSSPVSIEPARVLIFNSFSYPRAIPEYAQYSTAITQKYADLYGYTYKQFNHPPDKIPPYWLRVKDTYDLLLTEKYDVIIYLDLDATFNDFTLSINDVISEDYDFYIGRDPPSIQSGINNIVNTGCYIVRNTDWSKNFIKSWLYGCVNDNTELVGKCKYNWEYKNSSWSCPRCKWAGTSYEQGALATLYVANVNNAQSHICIFYDTLTNTNQSNKSYVLHLMANSSEKRTRVFKSILSNFVE